MLLPLVGPQHIQNDVLEQRMMPMSDPRVVYLGATDREQAVIDAARAWEMHCNPGCYGCPECRALQAAVRALDGSQ